VITISERAIKELLRTFSDQGLSTDTYVRVGVKGGGCSGFSYSLGFDDEKTELDLTFEGPQITMVCDPKSFLYLNGTELDFEESLMSRGFTFKNPNAAKSCGCGESFGI
jgi:iron-sulfur cluster assembly protein